METITETRRRPSLASMIVWVLFCFVMWGWAILGPVTFVLGLVQVYVNPEWLNVELGATRREQQQTLTMMAVLGAAGLAFVVLRLRGHIRFGERD